MLRRLLLGVRKGALIGGLVGSLWVFVLGIPLVVGVLRYLAAILTGVFAALVAGKPIWSRGAWIEVLLKSVVAAALGAGVMYAFRSWLDATISVGPLGQGLLSTLPFVMLPLLATVLAVFFEVDNTDEPATETPDERAQRQRVGGNGAAADADAAEALEAESEPVERPSARRKA